MTRVVIKNGDIELPEAELVGESRSWWATRFDNEDSRGMHSWFKGDWPDSYIVEPKRDGWKPMRVVDE